MLFLSCCWQILPSIFPSAATVHRPEPSLAPWGNISTESMRRCWEARLDQVTSLLGSLIQLSTTLNVPLADIFALSLPEFVSALLLLFTLFSLFLLLNASAEWQHLAVCGTALCHVTTLFIMWTLHNMHMPTHLTGTSSNCGKLKKFRRART